MSSKGREAFDSAAKVGVSRQYNGHQLSQVFHGIQVALEDTAAEGGRDPIVDAGDNSATIPTGYPDPDYPDLQPGDIWIDTNSGLNIWYNDQWNQAKVYTKNVLPNDDAPFRTVPTIITPNDEEFFNQAEYNEWLYTRTDRRPIVTDEGAPTIHPDFPAYPLREGDYWIDENHHLYYWNNDSDAWIPVDAGGGRLPIFAPDEPTEHPDYNVPDNELQVGDTWYDSDNSFKQYIYDGNDWIAITPDRHEAFTRVYEAVDPSSYNSGNIGTCALTGDGSLQGITNIQVAGTDLQNKIRLAFNNNERIIIEDDRIGAYAVYRITNIRALGDYDVMLIASNGTADIDFGETFSFGKLNDNTVFIKDSPPQYASDGELYWDSDEDDATLYIRYNGNWVTASPPVSTEGIEQNITLLNESVEAIAATASSHTLQIADAQSTQYALAQQVGATLENVNSLETSVDILEENVEKLENDVNSLETKVEALEGTVIDARYRLSTRPSPNIAEFQIYDGVGNEAIVWNQVQSVVFTSTDVYGNTHTFDTVGLEDLMRLGTSGSSAVFRIKSAATKNSIYTEFQLEYVSGTGIAITGNEYDFEFTPGFDPAAYATKQYVDDQDAFNLKKAGDSMEGVLNFKQQSTGGNIFRIYTKDNIAALRLYSDGSNDKCLRADIPGDKDFKIAVPGKMIFKVYGDGRSYLGDLIDPTDNRHAAHKKYVDDKVKQYADAAIADAINNLNIPDYAEPGPARCSWKYVNSGSNAPADGNFWFTGSHYNFSYITNNGINLGFRKRPKVDEWNRQADMTVWIRHSGTNWEMYDHIELQAARWSHETGGTKYFQFKYKWDAHGKTFATNGIYYITVGGWF